MYAIIQCTIHVHCIGSEAWAFRLFSSGLIFSVKEPGGDLSIQNLATIYTYMMGLLDIFINTPSLVIAMDYTQPCLYDN